MEDISISMNSSLTARKTIYNHIHTLTLFLYNGAKRIYSDSWNTEDHWSLTLGSKINIQEALSTLRPRSGQLLPPVNGWAPLSVE